MVGLPCAEPLDAARKSLAMLGNRLGGFHTPIAGWFIREHPIEMDDLGNTPILGKPPFNMTIEHNLPIFFVDVAIKTMIYHSYVSLPEDVRIYQIERP